MNALLLAYLDSMVVCSSSGHAEPTSGLRNWFEDLTHEDPGVRDAVREHLLRHGETAVPCLLQLLSDGSESIRRWAADTLLAMGPVARAPLQDALERGTLTASTEARRVLRRMRVA